QSAKWNQRKAKPLLCYLVLQRTTTRDQLCDIFWPDIDIQKAKNQLRVSINHLKHLLTVSRSNKEDFSFLKVDRQHISLRGHIDSDLINYLQLMKEARMSEDERTRNVQYKKILESRSNQL